MSNEKKGLTKEQKTLLSGLGGYASHRKISYNEWQADKMIAKQGLPKKKSTFMYPIK